MKLWLPALLAQSAILTISTFDSQHRPISAAKLYLQSTTGNKLLTGQTDSTGIYRFTVPPGDYSLRAETRDKGESTAKTIKVERTTAIELTLEPQFFDEPQFTVAGVTDNTYRGGHGADTILRSSEDLSKATASLGQTESSGNALEAVKQLQSTATADPSETNLFNWGTELLSHRAPQPAIEVFTKGVRLHPESVRLLLGLASSYYAAGAYEQAAHCFFQATDIKPGDPSPYLFLAKVQAGEITGSTGFHDRMARFAKLQPGNPLANYYYGVDLWRNSDPTALPLLEKAVALDPKLAPAYLQIGIIQAAQQKYPEAISAYKKAIAEDPALQEAHYRLSEAYRLTGDHLKAQQELAAYRELSKQSAEKLEQERRQVQQFVIDLRNQ